MTVAEVNRLAQTMCIELTGAPGHSHEPSMQFAYSRRRGTLIREWNVVCDTERGEYLLRINALTGRVYAINRLAAGESAPDVDPEAPPASVAAASQQSGEESGEAAPSRINRFEAESQALHYLALLGIPPRGLSTVVANGPIPGTGADQWNFTFRRYVPGLGPRLLKVSVNSKDGDLEDAWNPVYAL